MEPVSGHRQIARYYAERQVYEETAPGQPLYTTDERRFWTKANWPHPSGRNRAQRRKAR